MTFNFTRSGGIVIFVEATFQITIYMLAISFQSSLVLQRAGKRGLTNQTRLSIIQIIFYNHFNMVYSSTGTSKNRKECLVIRGLKSTLEETVMNMEYIYY